LRSSCFRRCATTSRARRSFYDAPFSARAWLQAHRAIPADYADRLWRKVSRILDPSFATTVTRQVRRNGAHVGFSARSRDAVHRFHKAALAGGGTDDGAPGPRPDYGPGLLRRLLLRDPFGNKVEATTNMS